MSRQIITTPHAPAAIGPYSQAVVHNGVVYCSGQVALDPATGAILHGNVAEQTQLTLQNLGAVLEAAGSGFDQALRLTVYLKDMNDFGTVNEVYSAFFEAAPPARACVEVARLPKDVLVEIDAIAAVR